MTFAIIVSIASLASSVLTLLYARIRTFLYDLLAAAEIKAHDRITSIERSLKQHVATVLSALGLEKPQPAKTTAEKLDTAFAPKGNGATHQ